jgi:predicted TIM-barrel fold metal-dependent hydrolase
MEEHDISACVLSAPASANNATGQEARDIARRTNEVLAEIISKHSNRFGAVSTLPGLDADGAIAEIGYALDTLKMDGVARTTSINDTYLGEPQFDPWFEELNRRSATLFVHPTITKAGETLLNGLNASVIEFMFDTTRMITNMVATGAKKRFPQIKIISTHGGGTIPYLVNRIQTLEHTFGVGAGRLELSSEELREGIASFYYDLTAATSEAQLGGILKLVPASQLLMGLDLPFSRNRPLLQASPTLDVTQHSAKRICEAARTQMPSACTRNSLSGSGRAHSASYHSLVANPARRNAAAATHDRRNDLEKGSKTILNSLRPDGTPEPPIKYL